MKNIIVILFLFATRITYAQTHKLVKLWSTDAVIATPESVLPDLKNSKLYVSLIDGDPWGVDHKGGVGRLNSNGTGYDSLWITGLNAPKGLGMFGEKIYAADISDVVVIDVSLDKELRKIPIPGASGLNDITVSAAGIVYVSDSKTGKIWKLENEVPTLFLDQVMGANGLLVVKDGLVFAEDSTLMFADKNKKLRQIANVGQSIDGIEAIGNGDYLVTSWFGYVFYVYANGKFDLLLDTHDQKVNSADIGFDPVKKIVYVPTFFDKRIVAYQLQ